MAVPNAYLLKCWHKIVSNRANLLQIHEDLLKKNFIKKYDQRIEGKIKGFFASYPEGIFCWYKNNKNKLLISWNGKSLSVDSVETITWSSDFWGRHFVVFGNEGKVIMDFKYQTLKRLSLLNPFYFIFQFFCPDDDWGLAADLPSVVHSCFVNNTIFDDFEWFLKNRNEVNNLD